MKASVILNVALAAGIAFLLFDRAQQRCTSGRTDAIDQATVCAALERDLDNLLAQNRALEERAKKAEERVTAVQFELDQWGTRPGAPPGTDQPMQTARVLAADNDANIVVINLGADDGVKTGYRFTISRGSTYVSQIEITHVEAKQSAGRTITVLRKSPVREGDDATTAPVVDKAR